MAYTIDAQRQPKSFEPTIKIFDAEWKAESASGIRPSRRFVLPCVCLTFKEKHRGDGLQRTQFPWLRIYPLSLMVVRIYLQAVLKIFAAPRPALQFARDPCWHTVPLIRQRASSILIEKVWVRGQEWRGPQQLDLASLHHGFPQRIPLYRRQQVIPFSCFQPLK